MTNSTDPPDNAEAPDYHVYYDGLCQMCRQEVDRLVRLSGGRLKKEPFQSSWPDAEHPDEIKLAMPDGRMFGGAEAIVRSLMLNRAWRLLVWIYFVPIVRQLANAVYRLVAANRYRISAAACPDGTCSSHRSGFLDAETPLLSAHRADYRRSTKIFFVLFGLISASAFASLFVQVPVLMGSEGLLPAAEWLDHIEKAATERTDIDIEPYRDVPTLFWMNASDGALRGGCILGIALSLCVVVGFFRRVSLILLGALYISYVTVGRTFFSFQWDNLLIETTLHALLLPTYSLAIIHRGADRARRLRLPGTIIIFLMHWLLFRIYFESGIAKLLYTGGGWRDLTAMSHYYNTAPLPTWIGWYAHNMSEAWHRWESLLTLLIEVVAPILIFFGRRGRRVAFVLFQSLQIAIALTANYGLFNYLTFALGFFLLEDRDYQPLVRLWRRPRPHGHSGHDPPTYAPSVLGTLARGAIMSVIAAAIVLASLLEFALLAIHEPQFREDAATWRSDYYYGRLRLVNAYHLFANMTTERVVPRFEGLSNEGEWISYRYRWAPAEPGRPPRFAAPHHPRLDFQIWFSTLSSAGIRDEYFMRLLSRLCEDPEFASRVFRENPFGESGPQRIRVSADRYEMTTHQERADTGHWWKITPARRLTREIPCRRSAPDKHEDRTTP